MIKKVKTKNKEVDPGDTIKLVKENWWWIGPALKQLYQWLQPQVKKLFTSKKKKRHEDFKARSN